MTPPLRNPKILSRAYTSKKLGIFIDSRSIAGMIASGNEKAASLLDYRRCDEFEFVRSPAMVKTKELQEIPQCIIKAVAGTSSYTPDSNLLTIEIVYNSDHRANHTYYRNMDAILQCASMITGMPVENMNASHNSSVIEDIELLFIQRELNWPGGLPKYILCTENQLLIDNRSRIETKGRVNNTFISSVEETMQIMDLYSKSRGKYLIAPSSFGNEGFWYLISLRSKLPRLSMTDPYLSAISVRVRFMLKAIDEIGMQFFQGPNNDTLDNAIYHFNYLISLATGTLDTLALFIKKHYDVAFEGDNIPARTSLNKKSGKLFLKEVKSKNDGLVQTLDGHNQFVEAIYRIREAVIHREMLKNTIIDFSSSSEKWQGWLLSIDSETYGCLCKQLENDHTNYSYIVANQCGIYPFFHKDQSLDRAFLEPYYFSKYMMSELINLLNEVSESIGLEETLEEIQKNDPQLVAVVKGFTRSKLGF